MRRPAMYALLIGLGVGPDVELPLLDRYTAVSNFLEQRGFADRGGMLFFGNEQADAVDCVLAVQELRRTYDLFKPFVRDIRMLRIEANNDLAPALD